MPGQRTGRPPSWWVVLRSDRAGQPPELEALANGRSVIEAAAEATPRKVRMERRRRRRARRTVLLVPGPERAVPLNAAERKALARRLEQAAEATGGSRLGFDELAGRVWLAAVPGAGALAAAAVGDETGDIATTAPAAEIGRLTGSMLTRK